MLGSDLHLGHEKVCRFRPQFSSAEEHHEVVFDNFATGISKYDTLYLLGDVAFDKFWLEKIKNLRCRHKVLIVGNHDLDRKLTMRDMVDSFDKVFSLLKKGDFWFSHCPIHSEELRKCKGNIHGHTHFHKISDPRYVNVCLEQTNYKPITFEKVVEIFNSQQKKEVWQEAWHTNKVLNLC